MASTTTSDSEDFESADEDIVEETRKPSPISKLLPTSLPAYEGVVEGEPVPSLKSNCQKELNKQNKRHSGDTIKPLADESGVQKIESGSGDLASKSTSKVKTSEEIHLTSKNAAIADTDSKEDSATDEPPIERRRRQQKQREPKSGASKKLGTKITVSSKMLPSTKMEHSQTNQPENTENQINTELDPYAKFRGYSKPPIMQRCWETGPDEIMTISDDHVEKMPSHDEMGKTRNVSPLPGKSDTGNTRESDPDPYAKFRGYSKPPVMQRCWETDPDGKAVLDDHFEKMPSHETMEETRHVGPSLPPASKEDTTNAALDPYAKFRGYSEPPLMEQCWEDDVDGEDLVNDVPVKDNVTNENIAPMFDKLSQAAAEKASPSGWGGWGNWGVTSLLSSATEGVSTLTSHVTSVLESGIGAPNPEELARIDRLEEKLMAEMKSPEPTREEEKDGGIFGFGQLMTSMSKLVETTGSKVLSGGLDTLETIGKKTMEVLQDGDPGLKKKRALFTDKTVLSQILREAKDKAETEDKETADQQFKRNVHFETLFDDYQGLVHLEALEMLSKQCDMKLQALLLSHSGPSLTELQDQLRRVKELCQLPDDEDMAEEDEDQGGDWEEKLAAAEKGLGVPLSMGKLAAIWKEITNWLKEKTSSESEGASTRDIHQKAVSTLARLTAVSVEQFHKGAEMLLVKDKRDSAGEAEALITITTVLCCQASTAATRFCELLNESKDSSKSEDVNLLITNIFLEASNSSSYIQEAFQLLIPVLQVGSTV